MILSDVDIIKLIKNKKLVIIPEVNRVDIKEANIDLHLSLNYYDIKKYKTRFKKR